MNLCLCLLMKDEAKVQSNYEKIATKFRANNNLISTENVPDIYSLRDKICSSGSKYEKIVVVNIKDEFNHSGVANAIADIAGALGVSQSITVCDSNNCLANNLANVLIEYPDNIIYTNLDKKTPSSIYNAVFGVKQRDVSNETETALNNIRKARRKAEDNAESVPTIDDSEVNAEELAPVLEESNNDEVEDGGKKKKKFGLGNIFKRKNKNNNSEDNEPAPIALVEEDSEDNEPAPIAPVEEDSDEVVPVSVVEDTVDNGEDNKPLKSRFGRRRKVEPEPEIETEFISDEEETTVIPEAVSSDDNESDANISDEDDVNISNEDDEPMPVLTDDIFTTPEPIYDEDEEDEMPEPVVKVEPVKRPPAPKPETTEIESEDTSKKKKKFGKKAKSNAPKVDNSGLSMQTRPRIVYVTGTGRIGQSTIAASLGFTAAQFYCKSLIVDMDMIRRAISCIYQDYSNTNSMHNMGLISAIRSPHLIDEIATEHYDNVSTLGVSITANDNREIMNTVSADAVQSLLLHALTQYNLVVVDMPWDYLTANPVLMTVPHDILFTTSNDIMTMISDLNQLTPDSFSKPETFNMLISKMRFVLNMTSSENVYERKTITEKNFNKVCYILTEEEMFTTIPVIANIPIIPGVGNQAAYGKPASSYSDDFSAYCAAILHELK